jgi:tetratricopeptide (TPR) repeat protein
MLFKCFGNTRMLILGILIIAGSASRAWSQDGPTAGELLKAGLNAMEAKQNERAIDYFYAYISNVELARAPRVIAYCQDIRFKLATLLIEEQRHKEACSALLDYLNGRYVESPRQAMKMLITCYYEMENWRDCVEIATRALEYNEYPWSIPQKRPGDESDQYSSISLETEKEFTSTEVSDLKNIREKALLKEPKNESPIKDTKHDFALAPEASKHLRNLFGEKLRNADQQELSINVLTDKKIGIYFAAQGNASCSFFSPKLVTFHQELTEERKTFEIVFVSADRDESSMYEFMRKMRMPWPALPYESEKKKELAHKYGVKNIPALVIINPNGEVITLDGKQDVARDGKKAFESWTAK